jgi:AcrR family transcriptional regulator
MPAIAMSTQIPLSKPPAGRADRKSRKGLPVLALKKQPEQRRAAATFERILEVGAQTLAEVGIDRLSTNLICRRAGLSPPALYRYFPNKYALLVELARRLMARQNELIPRWITSEVFAGAPGRLEAALYGLLLDTYRVTRETTAGVWITRALRAVPALAQVRLESHAQVTRAHAELSKKVLPGVDPAELQLAIRITVELIYAAVEMLLDEPPVDAQATARIVASMTAGHLLRMLDAGGAPPASRTIRRTAPGHGAAAGRSLARARLAAQTDRGGKR